MIKLTRLNHSVFYLNADLIETVEANPDTVVKLTNGKKYVVEESPDTICDLVMDYRRRMMGGCYHSDRH
ncbi:MAG: flagellar FlbD family protein [Halanaerobium sp.]|nr:flagellar FlbD family protein [Halanaerobium sp.]